MNLRRVVPLLFGAIGVGILLGLGFWQLDRLDQKQTYLADLEARIAAAPVALPATPDPAADRFLPVITTGTFTGQSLNVLVSRKQIGPGVRIIEAFVTDTGRRVLVDRGFVAEDARKDSHPATATEITGNLHWPVETDGFTPAPDTTTGLWFARDVPAMAAALQTDPVLIVARSDTGGGVEAIGGGHIGHAERPSAICDHVVFAGSGLGGDDSVVCLAYQTAHGMKV